MKISRLDCKKKCDIITVAGKNNALQINDNLLLMARIRSAIFCSVLLGRVNFHPGEEALRHRHWCQYDSDFL